MRREMRKRQEKTVKKSMNRLDISSKLNLMFITVPLAVLWLFLDFKSDLQPVTGMVAGIGGFVFAYIYSSKVFNGFDLDFQSAGELCYSQLLAILFADFVSLVIYLLFYGFPSVLIAIPACLLMQVILSGLWVYAMKRNSEQNDNIRSNVLLICDSFDESQEKLNERGLASHFSIDESWTLPLDQGDLDHLDLFSSILIDVDDQNVKMEIIRKALEKKVPLFTVPETEKIVLDSAKRMFISHLPIMEIEGYRPSVEFLFLKRLIDLAVSGAALILVSPIMIITALAIFLEDRGPVFYSQERLTQGGKVFSVLKFRSMRTDAEANGIRLSSGKNDSRVTRTGKLIRGCRIDELPQLLNVLKGDMSLVGPRPERPQIAEEYEKVIPDFRLRLQAKAGLTGLAQVYGKYNTSPQDKLQMDLMYIANPSIIEDLSLMLATVKVLLMPESTEGISADSTTALKVNKPMLQNEKV